jgi:arsenate reductase
MKRALVLGAGNACRSQMAASYLSFYAQGSLEVACAGLEQRHPLDPRAAQAMAEDNLNLASCFSAPLSAFAGQHFDFLITLSDGVLEAAEEAITFGHRLSCAVPDPAAFQGSEAEIEAEYRRVRELVKKKMLKFIGEALLKSPQLAA